VFDCRPRSVLLGATPTERHAAVVIEEIAALATHTITANPKARAISKIFTTSISSQARQFAYYDRKNRN